MNLSFKYEKKTIKRKSQIEFWKKADTSERWTLDPKIQFLKNGIT